MGFSPAIERVSKKIRYYDFYAAVQTLMDLGYEPGRNLRLVPRRGTYFPGSDLDSLQQGIPGNDLAYDTESDRRYMEKFLTLVVNTLGLFGPDSVLPYYFNYIISTDIETGPNLAGLLEILNDRLYRSMYRVWAIPRRLGRSSREEREDRRHILAMCGLNIDQLPLPENQMNVSFLIHASRSSWGLTHLAMDALGVNVTVDERVPFRVKLDPSAQSRIGQAGSTLGKDMFLGDEITDISMYYRAHFGPMNHEDFMAFLPAGEKYRIMLGILDLFTPFHLKYDIELKVQKEDVHKIKWRLGKQTSRLGFATVMKSEMKSDVLVARWRKRNDGVQRI